MKDLVSVLLILPDFFKSQTLVLYKNFRDQNYKNKELIIVENG